MQKDDLLILMDYSYSDPRLSYINMNNIFSIMFTKKSVIFYFSKGDRNEIDLDCLKVIQCPSYIDVTSFYTEMQL
jgi:hypothetical protein